MPETLQQLMSQLKAIWAELSGSQRLTIGVVLVGVLGLLGGLVYYGSRPEMVPLAGELAQKDVAKVTAVLEEEGVGYRYEGGTILVPRSKLGRLQLRLAEKGVTPGERGVNDWSEMGSMMDNDKVWDQKLKERNLRLLERFLESFDYVERAHVQAAIPKTRLTFADRKNARVKATVMIDTAAGRRLNAVQREEVINAVVSSIERLEKENVTLACNGSGGAPAADQEEDRFRADLQRHLDNSFGPGLTDVTVHVKRDMSRKMTLTKTPTKGAKIKENSETEERPIAARNDGGFPGTKESISGEVSENTLGRGAGEIPKEVKSRTDVVYQPGMTEVQEYRLPGVIEMVSASILVSENVVPAIHKIKEKYRQLVGAAGSEEKKVQLREERDKELAAKRKSLTAGHPQLAKIEKAAKAFLGIDDATGYPGTVSVDFVENMGDHVRPRVTGDPGLVTRDNIEIGVQILGALAVLIFLKRLLGRGRRGNAPEGPEPPEEETGEGEVDPLVERKRLRREIEKTVAGDPGAVGRLLAGWIQEK